VSNYFWKGSAEKIMREKLRNKKGFTLAELLIVVAIIAVLMAIMIPVFGNSRAAAILAKDAANLRSIYSEAVTSEMANDENYNSKGILLVNLKKYVDESGITFDPGTTAKYIVDYDANGVPQDIGKIEITHARAGETTEVIIVDKDMKLVTRNAGGSPTQVANGHEIIKNQKYN